MSGISLLDDRCSRDTGHLPRVHRMTAIRPIEASTVGVCYVRNTSTPAVRRAQTAVRSRGLSRLSRGNAVAARDNLMLDFGRELSKSQY
jgi:hypothetical protein